MVDSLTLDLVPSVFNLDTNMIPKVLESFQELGVKHEPLKLIPPQFETPLPPLQV